MTGGASGRGCWLWRTSRGSARFTCLQQPKASNFNRLEKTGLSGSLWEACLDVPLDAIRTSGWVGGIAMCTSVKRNATKHHMVGMSNLPANGVWLKLIVCEIGRTNNGTRAGEFGWCSGHVLLERYGLMAPDILLLGSGYRDETFSALIKFL